MKIWQEIKNQLEQGCSLYLLTVVESKGSAPGRVGFKMLVSDSSYLFGSIGGGIMEFNLVEKAKQLLKDNAIDNHIVYQDHRGSSKSSSGMICSGSQIVAFNHLSCDDLMLISACTQTPVMIELGPAGIRSIALDAPECFSVKFSDTWSYTELANTNNKPKAHIFGAGHVSAPTSELLTCIGFDVCLYDNREELNTWQDNDCASVKKVIGYKDILGQVNIRNQDFVLLMTNKFTEDKLILTQLLGLDSKYLGVLGSKNKIQVMFEALLKAGFKQKQLDNVHAPIGIDISSQTTQEIAISIVAEIIKTNNSLI